MMIGGKCSLMSIPVLVSADFAIASKDDAACNDRFRSERFSRVLRHLADQIEEVFGIAAQDVQLIMAMRTRKRDHLQSRLRVSKLGHVYK